VDGAGIRAQSGSGVFGCARGDRYNKKFNDLLDVWRRSFWEKDGAQHRKSIYLCLNDGVGAENPTFRISSRTAFARRQS